MNICAIGDIHGCLKEFKLLEKKIFSNEKFIKNKNLLIFLGDYIDRGLESKQVIDQIIKLKKNINVKFLMGNHEEFMIDFLFNKKNNIKSWLNFGVDQTFRSYNVEIVEYIKDGFDDHIINNLRESLLEKMEIEHKEFFKNLDLTYSSEKYLFVHAGIDPQKQIKDQTKKDFLWHRSENFFNKDFKFEKIIVHGHTPEENIINNPFRINVDTGCYFSGKLSCVLLNDLNDNREFLHSN
tara:strand:+ start:1067 stop:1780 length:714 start_codon:yes stop_codon:yes gene_type:complete